MPRCRAYATGNHATRGLQENRAALNAGVVGDQSAHKRAVGLDEVRVADRSVEASPGHRVPGWTDRVEVRRVDVVRALSGLQRQLRRMRDDNLGTHPSAPRRAPVTSPLSIDPGTGSVNRSAPNRTHSRCRGADLADRSSCNGNLINRNRQSNQRGHCEHQQERHGEPAQSRMPLPDSHSTPLRGPPNRGRSYMETALPCQ
jgi:hypothetical protein